MGRSSVGKMARPFSRFEELLGCKGVGSDTDEWPFMDGCSVYLRNNLSPWLQESWSVVRLS